MSKHIARKRFGQNFLIDRQVIADIVAALALERGDCVVEIGPGFGALTDPLLRRLDYLHVIEIDRDIVARLKQRYANHLPGQLAIHEGDALSFDFAALGDRLNLGFMSTLATYGRGIGVATGTGQQMTLRPLARG